MAENSKFRSRIGLIAATVGSAVGLGNIWRFPSEAQQNGGAAFLLLYIGCVIILGIPVMLSEFAIGRGGNSDSVSCYSRLAPGSKWYLNGWLGAVSSYLIAGFYMVVAGWTLEYLWESLSGGLYSLPTQSESIYVSRMEEMITSTWRPIIFTWLMIALNGAVLLNGVNKGIERISNILMPMLFVMLVVFAIIAMSLPGSQAGLEYFFHPDFSKITPATCVNALGQAFFSLSLGMGILITYASYYPASTRLLRTSCIVSSLGFIVAVLMGMIIFPAVTAFNLAEDPAALRGTTLVFVTLPEVFAHLPLSALWSTLFFFLLAVAAFTSTISLCEVTIRLLETKAGISRTKACWIIMLPLFAMSAVCSLSLGDWSNVTIMGYTIFDFLDNITTNFMLPICALFGCIFAGWVLDKSFLRSQLTNNGKLHSFIYTPIIIAIKYIAPILITIILIAQFFID